MTVRNSAASEPDALARKREIELFLASASGSDAAELRRLVKQTTEHTDDTDKTGKNR
jgi:hypothetical protein